MICFITLNLLLFPLKLFAGLISFSFKDISSLLRYAILKSSIYFNIGFKLNGKFFSTMIAYDMFYYVKFTALSIKTICRALSLLVLKILAVY